MLSGKNLSNKADLFATAALHHGDIVHDRIRIVRIGLSIRQTNYVFLKSQIKMSAVMCFFLCTRSKFNSTVTPWRCARLLIRTSPERLSFDLLCIRAAL